MRTIFGRKRVQKQQETSAVSSYAVNPFGVSNTMAAYKYGSYDNTFPSVCRIAEAFMTVIPYAVDANGEALSETPAAVRALYHPNREMSSIDFFETLIVCALVHPCVNILICHEEGGEIVYGANGITPDNIAGYVFLENAERVVTDGTVTYRTPFGVFTDKDVLSIRLNANPYSVLSGYSPSVASMKWSRLDDFMAEYQAGFFRNGACPSGQFIITASTPQEFEETVGKIKRATTGAEKNNKVLYIHRPAPILGAEAPAQIEWVPFSEKNKDISLKDLFEQVNRKIDMTFGVPSEVNGFIQNSNYASVSTADYIFSKRVVYPKLVKIWTRFTHELNRITGGLGYALSFDYDIPTLADETKIKAETKDIQLSSFLKAVTSGYTAEMAVNALDLPEEFLELKTAQVAPEQNATSEESAAPEEKHIHCGCGHCKDLGDTFDVDINLPERLNEDKIVDAIREEMTAQVSDSIKEGKPVKKTKKENKEFAAVLVGMLMLSAVEAGEATRAAAIARLKRDGVVVPDEVEDAEFNPDTELYDERLDALTDTIANFNDETANEIAKVFEEARIREWDQATIVEALRGLVPENEWRIIRLARTEQYAMDNLAWVDALMQLDKAIPDITVYKTWHIADSEACENCTALDGVRIPIAEPFVPQNTGMADGSVNTYTTVDAPLLHPNCRCIASWDFDWNTKSISVKCPKCGRFLMDAKECDLEKIICPNTACKARLKLSVDHNGVDCQVIEEGKQ